MRRAPCFVRFRCRIPHTSRGNGEAMQWEFVLYNVIVVTRFHEFGGGRGGKTVQTSSCRFKHRHRIRNS